MMIKPCEMTDARASLIQHKLEKVIKAIRHLRRDLPNYCSTDIENADGVLEQALPIVQQLAYIIYEEE
jgi:hypothetical protein